MRDSQYLKLEEFGDEVLCFRRDVGEGFHVEGELSFLDFGERLPIIFSPGKRGKIYSTHLV